MRVLGVGIAAAAANVPCGAWRARTRKFSAGWFAAVHAPVPVVACLRQACGLPPWAVAASLAGSAVGQAVGARRGLRGRRQPVAEKGA